jgi:very-short-patch-repair endonuclease
MTRAVVSGILVFALFFIGFLVWHFIPERRPLKPVPQFRNEPRAIASNPNWQALINEHCESPAETAFLTAMIEAHNLLPYSGSLKSNDLKIDFQVKVDRYRLDFLANEWLIIEIDGAAWHSSDEAKARDAARDRFFVDLGYSVLRIPARIVFNSPHEAVRRVDEALKVGKRVIPAPVQRSGIERLRQTVASTNKAMNEFGLSVERIRLLNKALSQAELAYHTEKKVIDGAVEGAERQLQIDDEIGDDEDSRRDFESHLAFLTKAIGEADGGQAQASEQKINLTPFQSPIMSGNMDADQEINERFNRMRIERGAYFDLARARIRADSRLAPLVQQKLAKYGCPQVWDYIA